MSKHAIPKRCGGTRAKKKPHTAAKVATVAVVSLAAGAFFGATPVASDPAPTPEPTPITISVSDIGADLQSGNSIVAMDLVSTEKTRTLLDGQIALSLSAQEAIWEICHENPSLFSTVLAIANKETGFDAFASGDGGKSLGLMQIHTYWQQDRIDALGVTDLLDYRENVLVAVDYLDWIAERLCPESPEDAYGTNAIFMAYNQGWSGAKESWSQGIEDTEYSRVCMAYYESYIDGLGVAP
jgi:hypothetical protein